MFSTVDSPASRIVRVELQTDVGRLPVALPPDLGGLASETKAAPSVGRVARLAERIGEQWWVLPRFTAPDGDAGDPGGGTQDQALQDLALDALREIVPVDAVQAVPPDRFDATRHRRVDVRGVTVAVLRLDAGAERPTLRPDPIRVVSVDLAGGADEGAG
jgi:hypothetical protein